MGLKCRYGKVWSLLPIMVLLVFMLSGCEEKSCYAEKLIGKWQLFKIGGSSFCPVCVEPEFMRIEEYTAAFESVSYDYQMNETGRRGYCATNSEITIYGFDQDYKQVKFRFGYSIYGDTLRLRYDGGYDFYDEFFVLLR